MAYTVWKNVPYAIRQRRRSALILRQVEGGTLSPPALHFVRGERHDEADLPHHLHRVLWLERNEISVRFKMTGGVR